MNGRSIWTALCIGLVMQLGAIASAQTQAAQGAAYGTREPRACPARKFAGAPTASQASALFVCDHEKYIGGYEYLVSNVKVETGKSRPFLVATDSGYSDIDVSARVYPIQGSFTGYQCSKRDTMLGQDPNRNCIRTDTPQATGTCYESTFGEWHCLMGGAGTFMSGYQLPPATP